MEKFFEERSGNRRVRAKFLADGSSFNNFYFFISLNLKNFKIVFPDRLELYGSLTLFERSNLKVFYLEFTGDLP